MYRTRSQHSTLAPVTHVDVYNRNHKGQINHQITLQLHHSDTFISDLLRTAECFSVICLELLARAALVDHDDKAHLIATKGCMCFIQN